MKRLVIGALLVGCGGEDGGGNGTIDIDNLGLELGVVGCSKQFECCSDAEIMQQYMGITFDGQPITTEEQCVQFTNAFFSGFAVAQYKDSIAMGRIEYDGTAAADCIAALNRVTCDQYDTAAIAAAASGCRPFILPKIADGGGCTQDYECTSDNCVGATVQYDGPDTDGMCQPMPTAGQSCDDNCADGLYCSYDQASGMDVCSPAKADGMECIFDRECISDNCDDDTDTCVTESPTCDGR
jgi:hypothetical protein